MTIEQLADQSMRHERDISALSESLKSAHKRIDENDRITEGIHKLAANMDTMAVEIRHLSERVEDGLKKQSEQFEHAMHEIKASQKAQGERIGVLESKPAKRWDAVVTQIIGLIVAAAVGGLISKLF